MSNQEEARRLLARQFDSTTLARGLAYQREGAARIIDVVRRGSVFELIAECQGSAPGPYRQKAAFRLQVSPLTISKLEGVCSCPMTFNCKHVAAVMAQWLDGASTEPEPAPSAALQTATRLAPAHPQMQTRVSPLVEQWAASLERHLPRAADGRGEQLRYVLRATTGRVEIYKVRTLASGALGKPAPYSFNSAANYSFGPRPRFFEASDMEVMRAMMATRADAYSPAYGSHQLRIAGAYEMDRVLLAMQATQRLTLETVDGPTLTLGTPLAGTIEWHANDDGRFVPLCVVDAPPGLSSLECMTPLYLNRATAQLIPVRFAQPREVLRALLDAPPLSLLDAAWVGQKFAEWGSARPGLELPMPRQGRREPVQPVLTLGMRAAFHSSRPALPAAVLAFDYGPTRVEFSAGTQNVISVPDPDAPQGTQVFLRDAKAEADAARRLAQSRLVPVAQSGPQRGTLFVADDAVDWARFMVSDVPLLTKAGWNIVIEPDFPYSLREAGEWWADAAPQGGDWFSLDLGVLIDGKPVSLVAALRRWLEAAGPRVVAALSGAGPTEMTALTLDDGHLLPIHATRIKAMLAPLMESLDAAPGTTAGTDTLRMSRYAAGTLADLPIPPDQWRGGETLRAFGANLRNFQGLTITPPAPGFKAVLRDYQQQGLNWLQFLAEFGLGGILADDMGLGKTVQTLAHLHREKATGRARAPSLVICPTSVAPNWAAEAARFAPGLRVLMFTGKERVQRITEIALADLVITTYALLPRDHDALTRQNWHAVVHDEAQFVKNPHAKAHQIAAQLLSTHRLSLTGTPLENHLGELWAQFNLLLPGLLGKRETFSRRFRTPIEKHGDLETRESLARRVRPFMLRRTRDQVLNELPPRTEVVRWIELEGAQRDLYEGQRAVLDKKLRDILAKKGASQSQIMILDALLKLRQTCCDPRLVKTAAARAVKESAKLADLSELLQELVSEDRRVLLFSQFTSMLALIEELLNELAIPYVMLTGDTGDRAAPVRRFQAGEVPVFLISLKAGGTGLNLTAADTVIHYDPWWNPAVEEQATGRAHRMGQRNPVLVYKLLARGTVEEKMLGLIERKRDLARQVLEGGGAGGHLITAADLDVLFEPMT